jgi:hypothetical protein
MSTLTTLATTVWDCPGGVQRRMRLGLPWGDVVWALIRTEAANLDDQAAILDCLTVGGGRRHLGEPS